MQPLVRRNRATAAATAAYAVAAVGERSTKDRVKVHYLPHVAATVMTLPVYMRCKDCVYNILFDERSVGCADPGH
jgi:hypothetical protein